MIVAGVMSGTSGDGINVALVEITGRGFRSRFRLLAHHEVAYPLAVRRVILSLMNARRASVAELARLNFLLGELYAEAVCRAARAISGKVELVGCHGQTLYHQGRPARYLGRDLAVTWQTGEGAIIAARTGIPVVTDFRPADMAAGGQGAPLVPFLDFVACRHSRRGRIVLNIGGIANLTSIPAGATPEQLLAFDTGPGNMVIDAVTERLFGKPYDPDGRIAASGKVLEPVLARIARLPFFRQPPPRTAGREQFGAEFASSFLRLCQRRPPQDAVATATALSARSIAQAVRAYVLPRGRFVELIVSGGGTNNKTLMRMLAAELPELKICRSDELGMPSQAKEAIAFAILAYQTWQRAPGNLPSVTGAHRPAVLGKISYP